MTAALCEISLASRRRSERCRERLAWVTWQVGVQRLALPKLVDLPSAWYSRILADHILRCLYLYIFTYGYLCIFRLSVLASQAELCRVDLWNIALWFSNPSTSRLTVHPRSCGKELE